MADLEFGGKLGAPFMLIGLPFAVYAINLACNPTECTILKLPKFPTQFEDYIDFEVIIIFLAWFILHAFIAILPIGQIHEGLLLSKLYGLDAWYIPLFAAFIALCISIIGFGVMVYIGIPVTRVYDKWIQIITTAILFSFILSVLLYIKSFTVPSDELASGGNSGNLLYDFFIGRELNPRIGELDLKFFCELRPGLIGWVMLDLCFLVRAYEENNGSIPPALVLVTIFHTWYVADALWYEEAILTTMDIVHDGFGFMLVFGDLAWVPFLYTLQARFILEHVQHWSLLTLPCIFLFNCLGYLIFRGANSQKNDFRKNPDDPNVKHLETMSTATGKKLLVSGWWGMCRHPNYLGDLIMALSWSLASGPHHILPYFYPIYFLILLIHRSQRDDASCRRKYGHDWSKYCKRVPSVIFPYIY